MRRTKYMTLLAGATIAGLALAGCAKGGSAAEGGAGEGVLTGAGIDGNTIKLGLLSDYSGPFSPLATEVLEGAKAYWTEKNAAGGVCDAYTVELVVRDHAFNVSQAVSAYQEIAQDVLAFQDFSGAAPLAAVLPDLEADSRLTLANSATKMLIDSPMTLIPAAHIGTDTALSTNWLLKNGKIAEGDAIAIVFQETDYGEQAKEGLEKFAEEHGMTVLPYQVKPTDADLTPHVNDALGKDAAAVVAAVSPGQTASIATVLQSAGASIPIAGVYTSYVPALLDTPAAKYLKKHFTQTSYITTFEDGAGAELYEKLSAALPDMTLTSNATQGYTAAVQLDGLLEAACAAGDLTPEGLAAQRFKQGPLDYNGLKVTFDYTETGVSPTNEAFIVQPDSSVPGSLRTISEGSLSLK
jgi:ABC-type branched-subunit amino acid transport system substrate-binding protein